MLLTNSNICVMYRLLTLFDTCYGGTEIPPFRLLFLEQGEPGCYQLHLRQKPRSPLCHRPYQEIHLGYVYSLLQHYPPLVSNNLGQWFNQSYHPFKEFFPREYLENERQCLFPRMSIHANLGWIVKIPDLEKVIMDTCNAIDQPMFLKENIFT